MNKIEDIFKKSLENAEAPYDANAWDSMVSRLDQVMPIAQPKATFKWAWVAGVVLVAGSTALYFVNQNTKSKDKTELPQNPTDKTNDELAKSSETIHSNKLLPENDANLNPAVETDATMLSTTVDQKSVVGNEDNSTSTNRTEKSLVETQQRVPREAPTERVKPTEIVKPTKQMSAPVEEKISKDIVLTKVDFSASNETFYEKGLPFNSLTSNVEAKKYKWTNERGEILSTDKNADIHLFNAGTHLITLTVEYSNGEKQSVTKPVRCEVNYNLLAVTGFNPASSDYRNNTFIPFALLKTERNIPFDMQIIDPQTGHVVFETKSADMPWDGIDNRTNQMVPVNSTYIWRVNIHEKAIGEPTNRYQGTITRI